MLAWPVRLLGLDWTMLLAYLAAQALILFCLHLLARRLVSRRAAYLAMVLFILPISIGGTFVRTYDNYFNPRTLTLPLGLLALLALHRRRVWPAALLIGLHLLLHPLSGLHTWLVAALLLAWWAWRGEVDRRALAGPAALMAGVVAYLALSGGGNDAWWLDPDWRAVLWRRTPYVFLASWRAADWISLGLYLLLGLIGWSSRRRDPDTTRLALAVPAVVFGATLAVALGVDGLGLAPLAQLQLARGWRLVIVLAVIFGAEAVLELYERESWGATLIAALLATAIYFDRADEAWQPALAVLLAATVLTRFAAARGVRAGVAGLLAASSVAALALPTLLRAWPVTTAWAPVRRAAAWSLPEDALWPALALTGLLLLASSLKRTAAREGGRWLQVGLGGALALAALAPLAAAGPGPVGGWPAYLNDRLQLPGSRAWMSPSFRAWQEVQLWAAGQTAREARFATDPDEKGFRVFSGRSPLVEDKDGAAAMFSRAYALEWAGRMEALAGAGVVDPDGGEELTTFSEEGLIALHGRYRFDYVVGRQPQSLPWPEVYRNDVYVVYAWPSLTAPPIAQ